MSQRKAQTQLEAESAAVERVWIDAAASGDIQAFSALYDLYLERAYRHVYYIVGRRADAEDITQECFLQARQAISQYGRTGASFVAWLLTVAHQQAMRFLARTDRPCPVDLDLPTGERWTHRRAEGPPARGYAAMRRAILRLRPEQRQVIVMRFVESFRCAEVAAALGRSEGSIRDLQHQALVELRQLLAQEVNT